jgi:hypothetical protein
MGSYGVDIRTISQLVADSITRVGGQESTQGSVEVIAVFDHDYQSHLLVQEWDRTTARPCWIYRLWFRDGDLTVPVHLFGDAVWPDPPFVTAAQIAADWRAMSAEESQKRHR